MKKIPSALNPAFVLNTRVNFALKIFNDSNKAIRSEINRAINDIFWSVGNILLASNLKDDPIELHKNIEIVSSAYRPMFGDYFSEDNLRLMYNFAKSCTRQTFEYVATIIPLEYLPLFVTLKSSDEWLYYAGILFNGELNIAELKDAIKTNRYQTEPYKKRKKSITIFDIIPIEKIDVFNPQSLLFGSNAENFRLFFEPKSRDFKSAFLTKHRDNSELMERILDCLTEKQDWYNNALIRRNNLLFLRLGECIKGNTSDYYVVSELEVCELVTEQLLNIWNYDFKKEIEFAVRFAQQHSRSQDSTLLSSLVPWKQIKLLLGIDSISAQMAIAKLVVEKGLTDADLNNLISEGNYEQYTDDVTADRKSQPEPTEVININKKTKNKIQITAYAMDPIPYTEHDINRNIFLDKDLLTLLSL